ncbi:MAG: baseplate J/gp47 family protein [Gorillibacterium sp.]|nr:baseplate J/gp47 family protein [Gorillibacterium sp.]
MVDLPQYLQDQTEDQIMHRMLDRIPADIDKAEGSFIWDAQAPVAFTLAEAAIWAQEVLRRGFARTTFGQYLDERVWEHGITRRAAIPASGSVQFVGNPGKMLPAGTIVATPADDISGEASIEYETLSPVTLDVNGEGTTQIRALVSGISGNVPAGVIDIMATPVTGIKSVKNLYPLIGGTDVESDTSLLERYYARIRSQGTSGNKAQYVQWALEVPGVGGVKVLPLWNGPKTVKVIITDTDKYPASPSLVEQVQAYIDPVSGMGEGQAPIGAEVTVSTALSKTINVAAKVILAEGYILQSVVDTFRIQLETYRKNVSFVATYVSHAVLGALLLSTAGVLDHSGLTINGSTANVALTDIEVPIIGTIELEKSIQTARI